MSITLVGAGTRSKVGSGDMTPGLPSGWAADDIHILLAICQNGETVSATGWTQKYTVNNNAAALNTQATVLWRRAVGGDSGPTVTGTGSGSICGIIGFRGCITSGDPFSASSSNATDANTATITSTGITPGAANEMIVFLGGSELGLSSCTYSSYSGTNPTFTEAVDDFNSTGADWTALFAAYGTSDGSATGDRTATCSTGLFCQHISFLLSLKVATGGGFTPLFRPTLSQFGSGAGKRQLQG